MKWLFREKVPAEKTRDPIQGEFFNTAVVDDSCASLIREGIQNALDAKDPKYGHIKVQITLSGEQKALSEHSANKWFGELYQHVQCDDIGLPAPPSATERCPVLLFEDFNTVGLWGDIRQHSAEPDIENPFFYFFRAEGKSIKHGENRGRWGLGKYVFPGSSRARTIMCLTRPKDSDNLLLMGQAVLKYHKLDGIHYTPDANWGEENPGGADLPTSNTETIDEFRQVFELKRKDEPGLSIAVPWYDTENTTLANLRDGVIRDYFWPIIQGQLVVSISDPNDEIVISNSNIKQLIDQFGQHLDTSLVSLALWSKTQTDQTLELNPVRAEQDTWSEAVFPPETLEKASARFIGGEKLCFKVPIELQPKKGRPKFSFFNVYLWKGDHTRSEKPCFIRNGIIIRDAGTRNLRGATSLVTIDDDACAAMLGDAENPAHTQWNYRTEAFSKKYKYPYQHLRAITDSAHKLYSYLSGAKQKENRTLLLNYFGLEEPEFNLRSEQATARPKKRDGISDKPNPEIQHSSLRRYKLDKREGGFSITKADANAPLPASLDIRMAYDIRSSSASKALNNYQKYDFAVGSPEFNLKTECMQILERKENRIFAKITGNDYALHLDGFDMKRDLVVLVKAINPETEREEDEVQ